ncbi:PREDICTED: uncharacterized protein LOC105365472 isoform X2 [Ceratosolen solmsi marchali]|uniref:Uncharacterized protein LOC105365472 isoform X2 n=1 Tax=Ceratosolen solmsi marchali TaxID=326594 RepID=A0AAJ7DZB9_9HYME|nr:PREDICTED: uncharacterized protein LOC105365472 isoform X2 [Ceratosolen solmsi marchali]
MALPNKITLFFWKITLVGYVIAYPDKYEFQDIDTNMKFNLLDILNDYTESEKDHRRDSTDDPYENWTGRWMPSRPGEPTPPPKVVSNKGKDEESHHDSRVPMGVKSPDCDDGKTNLTVDWDHSVTSYTCYGQKINPDTEISPELYCDTIPKKYEAIHKCMYESIEYKDDIPTYGSHRPIWPTYGEYTYVPKQRWIHNLEHGAVVMLYHPCANSLEVERLKGVVKGCLRRHIITPYDLDETKPLALVTWGCRLTMSHVNKELVIDFIKEHALHAPENRVYKDGDFDDQLIKKSDIVSDEEDSIICFKQM